ncbi:uncharacterized protein JCM15063_006124, partial [Sporobolomyces koalae]|uniref:uncharacterized protein n=1 Tax=Sporobolomyces koalae TaxID=500713 RepID=UPI003180AA78
MTALSDTESGEEYEHEIRVVWRTGPTQGKSSHQSPRGARTKTHQVSIGATPKPKRSTTSAGLASPTASGASEGSVLQPQRVAKKNRRKTRGPVNTGNRDAPLPMDQNTLHLVSQLALKVQARSNAGVASASGIDLRATLDQGTAGLRSKNRRGQTKANGVGEYSPRALPAPSRTLPFASSKPAVLRNTSIVKPTSPPAVVKSSAVRPSRSPTRPVAPKTVPADDDDYFDSYFGDFTDESFEIALSQLEPIVPLLTPRQAKPLEERRIAHAVGPPADPPG